MRSFRFQLSLRATAAMAVAVGLISLASVFTLASILERELRESILSVASIQAASVVDSPDGAMVFHEWELTPSEADAVRDLIRYAQVWSESGRSLLRSQFMTEDLPLDREALVEAGEGGALIWREQEFGGRSVLSLYYPLSRFGPAHDRHVLQVAAPLGPRREMVVRVSVFFAGVSLIVILASAVGSWWLAGRAVRPVGEIIDQAEEIGAGSLDRRIQAYAEVREYGRLVEVLNTMLSRIQNAFDAQTRFTADASHELRSPLTALRGEIEIALRKERSAEDYRAVLDSNLEEILRLASIAEELLTLARADAGALRGGEQELDVEELVHRTVDRIRPQAAAKGVDLSLETSLPTDRLLIVDPVLLGQIIWNLVENAVKFTPSEGRVDVTVAHDEGKLEIEVVDTGPGLGPHPERVFERFYRGDPARTSGAETSGTGLGLAIVRAIVTGLGGTIVGRDRPGGGSRFHASFPVLSVGLSPDGVEAPSADLEP